MPLINSGDIYGSRVGSGVEDETLEVFTPEMIKEINALLLQGLTLRRATDIVKEAHWRQEQSGS